MLAKFNGFKAILFVKTGLNYDSFIKFHNFFQFFLLYFVMMLGVDSILSKKKKKKNFNLNCVVQSIAIKLLYLL